MLIPRGRLRTTIVAVALCIFGSAADASAIVTSLMLDSPFGDYVGQGQRRFFWAQDASWGALHQPGGLVSFVVRPHGTTSRWDLRFASVNGAPLTVGTYSNVARVGPQQGTDKPGLDISGEGAGCSFLSGSFTVLEAAFGPNGQVAAFRATFEQLCGGSTAPLRGEIRYLATLPFEFSSTSITKATFGQAVTVGVEAYSVSGGAVTLSPLALPPGATFTHVGSHAGWLTWTPTLAHAGTHSVGFRGQNAQGFIDTVYIRIVVGPINDDVETAISLQITGSPGAVAGSNVGGTTQQGEYSSPSRSVWYRFTAAAAERLVFNTEGAGLAVYQDTTPDTGPTFSELVQIATGYPLLVGGTDSRLVFEATAGGVYYIAVGHWQGTAFSLQWRRAELTRLLWRHTSGGYAVWTIDGAGGVQFSPVFGPYPGWEVVRVGIGRDRRTRMLWRNASGLASIWTLDAAGQVVASPTYGPYDGWVATDLVVAGDGLIHVAWTHATGALRLWQMPADGKQVWSPVSYGPYAGWVPAGLALDGTNKRRIAWRNGATVGLWSEPYPGYPTVDAIYGPFADWSLADLAARAEDQDLRLLWHHDSGAIGLWRLLLGGGNEMKVLGPYPEWTATALAVSNASPSFGDVYPRILWRHTTGMIALWKTSASVDSYTGLTFGPYAGWTAIDIAVGPE